MISVIGYFKGLEKSYDSNGIAGAFNYELRSTGNDLVELSEKLLGSDITDSIIDSSVEGAHSLPRLVYGLYLIGGDLSIMLVEMGKEKLKAGRKV